MPYLPFYFDWTMILLIPGIIFAIWAQSKVTRTFGYYSRVPAAHALPASRVAEDILRVQGVQDVRIEMGSGTLTDHYNPRTKTIKLSPQICNSSSVAALAIAAHEAGHAMQHAQKYFFLSFRNILAPVASVASYLAFPLVFLGLVMGGWDILIRIGIYVFMAAVLFSLITLPVEYNASKRAMEALTRSGTITAEEYGGAHSVLQAAALTYVAATVVALLNLLRLLALSRRRN